MSSFYLKVDRDIFLRGPEVTDAEVAYRIIDAQREYLGEWLDWVHRTTTVQQTLDFIQMSIKLNAGGQKLTSFIFKNKQLVGSLSLVRISKEHRKAEIGYWLDENFQGQGIVSKSIAKFIEYSFDELHLNKLTIKVVEQNKKSCAVPLRLGFVQEGILRREVRFRGKFYNKLIFGLLKEEWQNKKL